MARATAENRKPINILIGGNIRKYRKEAGYTREKFAELIEVSPRFVYDSEVGASGISVTTLKKICEVLGISADKILWDKPTEPITLEERMKYLDEETQQMLHKNLDIQLEIIERTKKLCKASGSLRKK